MRVLLIGGGYVGSYLRQHLEKSGIVTLLIDQNPERINAPEGRTMRYQSLQRRDLADCDAILWFAGHSSVAEALRDPEDAIRNNVLDLFELITNKPAETKFIYASSASVYSGTLSDAGANEQQPLPIAKNVYDASKSAFDVLAAAAGKNVTGLRMGTVSGWSPHLREELVFNAMNLSAIRNGVVRIANNSASRTILFLSDLGSFVRAALDQSSLPAIVNCGSCNTLIGDLGERIARFHGVVTETLPDSNTYSFRMNTDLFDSFLHKGGRVTIESCCQEFVDGVTGRAG